jgi:hypothetical protein
MSKAREDLHRLTKEGWEKAQADKAQHRAENRAKWARRRDWGTEEQATAPITLESAEEANGSDSLQKLRRIMGDTKAPLFRRLDAAEVVLGYELAPGAAAGADPEAIAASSYSFLRAIAEAPEVPEALQFRALKCVAQVENVRSQIRSAAEQLPLKRELLVRLCNAERVRLLCEAQRWPPPRGAQWQLTSSDDLPWPPNWPGSWVWPPDSLASTYDRPSEVIRASFGAIRARNREDEFDAILHEGG